MTYCPKFIEMEKMFHGKVVIEAEIQLVFETNNHYICECGEC
jgi:hypothetical protein